MDFKTIPEGLDVIQTGDGEIIRKKWFDWKAVFTTAFALFWCGFLFFFYRQMLHAPHAPVPVVLFTLPHAAVGLGMLYFSVASFVNKTDVEVSPRGVSVRTGPLPWLGNRTVESSDVTAVEVRQRRGGRGGTIWALVYADRERREKTLISFLYQPDQLEYVAFALRRRLGLNAAPR
jgi:hypothetical protein